MSCKTSCHSMSNRSSNSSAWTVLFIHSHCNAGILVVVWLMKQTNKQNQYKNKTDKQTTQNKADKQTKQKNWNRPKPTQKYNKKDVHSYFQYLNMQATTCAFIGWHVCWVHLMQHQSWYWRAQCWAVWMLLAYTGRGGSCGGPTMSYGSVGTVPFFLEIWIHNIVITTVTTGSWVRAWKGGGPISGLWG